MMPIKGRREKCFIVHGTMDGSVRNVNYYDQALATMCLPDITAHDETCQAFPFYICIQYIPIGKVQAVSLGIEHTCMSMLKLLNTFGVLKFVGFLGDAQGLLMLSK